VTDEDLTSDTATRHPQAATHRVIDLTQEPAGTRDVGQPDQLDATPHEHSPADPRSAALAAFAHAVSVSTGYRTWLQRQGAEPARVTAIEQVPYIEKRDVFGADLDTWLDGGITAAAELLTSSGQTGTFSAGITSHAELRGQQAATDAALRALGAGDGRSTLLLNCLPMGIAVPTTIATVATPSVHLEMAQELLERFGPAFDLVVVLAEPVFLKELAERIVAIHGAGWTAGDLACVVGGEWVSESWRRHVSGLLGLGPAQHQGARGVLISMGAAELGLHLLFETPELRTIRSLLDTSGQARDLFAHAWGYTPTLFSFDPTRLHIEERRHGDGVSTLAITPLARRLLPLVRYDLGDIGELVPPERLNARLAAIGAPQRVDRPVVACWGRRGSGLVVGDRVIRPELIKQRLFRSAADAAVLTGRFYLEHDPDPVLHVQRRAATVATPGLAADLGAFVSGVARTSCRVAVHAHDAYPYHLPGDYQHKPRYHAMA
jgi:phenylacetate-CoA ligase